MAKRKPVMRSLVGKYVILCLSIILAGLVIFGAILLAFSKDYFDQETSEILTRSAKIASTYTTEQLSSSSAEKQRIYFNVYRVTEGYNLLSSRPGYTLFFTDQSGEILLYVQDSDSPDQDYPDVTKFPADALQIVQTEGIYEGSGKINGMYTENHTIVVVPVYAPDETQIVGYVFASSSGLDLQEYLMNVLEIFILGAVAVLAFTFTMISIGTDRFMQPLKEMSEATVSFGQGDFSRRVSVDPNSFDEMNQLAIAFNHMASALAAHEKSSRNFVANVSHELKTPMTTIGGFIDGIRDGTIPPEEEDRYLTIVSDEIKRLSRLVVSMLNLSRMESGEVHFNPTTFDVGPMAVQIVLTFEQRIEAKNLEVRGLEDAHDFFVESDVDMIHQVIYNLVDNAVKFVNQDGYLEFSFEEDMGMVHIGIKNSGDGISKEEIQQVFDRFYKTDKSRSLDKSGVGLGLYIVQSIIALVGGDISVRSVQGEFCEFVIAIPAAKPETLPRREKKIKMKDNSSTPKEDEEPLDVDEQADSDE